MKLTKYLFILLIGMVVDASAANWRPNERFLYAVRYIESSHGRFVYGDRGDSLGDFQMSEAAWTDVTAFRKSRGQKTYSYKGHVLNKKINRMYAADYMTILYVELKKALKRPPTASEVYAAYNMGLKSFKECNYQIKRVNPITAEKCELIKEIMKDKSK